MRTGEQTIALAALRRTADRARTATDKAGALTRQRDNAIREALAAGIDAGTVSAVTGVSRRRVNQINNCT